MASYQLASDPEEDLELNPALLIPLVLKEASSSLGEVLISQTLSPCDNPHKYQELLQKVVLTWEFPWKRSRTSRINC